MIKERKKKINKKKGNVFMNKKKVLKIVGIVILAIIIMLFIYAIRNFIIIKN